MALGSLTDQSPRMHRWNTFIAGLGIDADWRTADGRDEKRRDGQSYGSAALVHMVFELAE